MISVEDFHEVHAEATVVKLRQLADSLESGELRLEEFSQRACITEIPPQGYARRWVPTGEQIWTIHCRKLKHWD